MQCTWVITVKKPSRILLTFEEFDLEGGENCRYDFVSVRDGTNANENEIGRYCGKNHPQPTISTFSTLYIVFQSDKSGVGKGFAAKWVVTNLPVTIPTISPTQSK